jgi:hypothetical protein
MLRGRGRSIDGVEVSICPYMREVTAADVEAYGRAGVDRVIVLGAARDVEGMVALLDTLAKGIIEPASHL